MNDLAQRTANITKKTFFWGKSASWGSRFLCSRYKKTGGISANIPDFSQANWQAPFFHCNYRTCWQLSGCLGAAGDLTSPTCWQSLLAADFFVTARPWKRFPRQTADLSFYRTAGGSRQRFCYMDHFLVFLYVRQKCWSWARPMLTRWCRVSAD